METAHADVSTGIAAQPAAVALSLASSPAAFLAMPALADRQGLAVSQAPRGYPRQCGPVPSGAAVGVVLVSQATGAPAAIIHGQIPTRIRTAAASAVASRHLARARQPRARPDRRGRPRRRARPLSSGSKADRTRARVVADHGHRRPLHRTDRPRLTELVVEGAASPREVFANSDIVCTLTPSREPVVEGPWFKPGLHVNAVGAPPRPDHREIDSAGMARARVFLDSIDMAMHNSGDLLLAIADGAITKDHVATELGDVITGAAPGRTSRDDITLFNSVGLAIQDLAICSLLLARARQKGVGQEIDLGA